MPTSSWSIYSAAKRGLMSGALDLDAGGFAMSLHAETSNATDPTLSTLSQVTDGLISRPMVTTWQTVPGDPTKTRFDASPVEFAGPVTGARFAVIAQDGVLLCYDELSASAFDIADGRSLTVTMNPTTGVFSLG